MRSAQDRRNLSAGGYRIREEVRAGLPLAILMIVTLTVVLLGKYRL